MKVAMVRFSTDGKYGVHGTKSRLPQRLLEFYIENFRPYTIEEFSLAGTNGYFVRLNAGQEALERKNVKWQSILEELCRTLCDKEVEIVIPPETGLFPGNILRLSWGRAMNGLFVMDAVKKALKMTGKDLKDAKIVLIDGRNFMTQLVLDRISPYVNFLAVYTDRQEDFADAAEKIFEDCGLALQTFANGKNPLMKEADIILNCSTDIENYDYAFQKGAVYFDFIGNREKILRIQCRRGDILVADGLSFKKGNDFLTGRELEAVEYIKFQELRLFLDSRYEKDKADEVEGLLKNEDITLSGLLCFGKPAKIRGISSLLPEGSH